MMADHKPAPEPTMEEILSSIRRIIAEDEEKGEPASPARGDAGLAGGDEVLDLTDVVPEAGAPRPQRVAAATAPPATVPPRPAEVLTAQAAPTPPSRLGAPRPPTPTAGAAMPPPATEPLDAAESLISAEAAKVSAQALARLARASGAEERRPLPGGGLPVEQFLSELLTPLLREWLEKNLPEIVERVVEQEVKKLARRAELL